MNEGEALLGTKAVMFSCCVCFRMGGEEAEIRFCEHKRLNMATLRMTWEAKVQLKEILINSGFPEGTVLELPLHSGSFLVIRGV